MVAAFESAPAHLRPHFPKYKETDPRAIDDLPSPRDAVRPAVTFLEAPDAAA